MALKKGEPRLNWWTFVPAMLAVGISIFAVGISIYALWLTHLAQGKVEFALPNVYHIGYAADDNPTGEGRRALVTMPVAVTNTGAVVHTVTRLEAVLDADNGTSYDLDMYVAGEQIPLPDADNANAVPFAIAPRSSAARVVGFLSRKQLGLAPGSYAFRVHAFIDSEEEIEPTAIQFTIELTEDQVQGLDSAQLAFVGATLDREGQPVLHLHKAFPKEQVNE